METNVVSQGLIGIGIEIVIVIVNGGGLKNDDHVTDLVIESVVIDPGVVKDLDVEVVREATVVIVKDDGAEIETLAVAVDEPEVEVLMKSLEEEAEVKTGKAQGEHKVKIVKVNAGVEAKIERAEGVEVKIERAEGVEVKIERVEGAEVKIEKVEGVVVKNEKVKEVEVKIERAEGVEVEIEKEEEVVVEIAKVEGEVEVEIGTVEKVKIGGTVEPGKPKRR